MTDAESDDGRLAQVRLIDGPFDNIDLKMGLPLPNVLGYSRDDALHVYGRDMAISLPRERTFYSYRYVGAQTGDGEIEPAEPLGTEAAPELEVEALPNMTAIVQLRQRLWITLDHGEPITCEVRSMQSAASGPDDGLVGGLNLDTVESKDDP